MYARHDMIPYVIMLTSSVIYDEWAKMLGILFSTYNFSYEFHIIQIKFNSCCSWIFEEEGI